MIVRERRRADGKREKREMQISGDVLMPVHVGDAAIIDVGGELLRTSTVLRILEASAKGMVIETRNSIYSVDFLKNAR